MDVVEVSIEAELIFLFFGAALKHGSKHLLDPLPQNLKTKTTGELTVLLNSKGTNELKTFLGQHAKETLKQVEIAEALPDLSLRPTHHKLPLFAFKLLQFPKRTEREFQLAVESGVPICRGYHGSDTQNWFSILSSGLRNFSGHHGRTTRSAFGEGIYASSELHVAKDFANSHSSLYTQATRFLDPQLTSVAAVDIARSDSVATKDSYFVVAHEGHIVIRYLLVYGRPQQPGQPARTRDVAELEHRLKPQSSPFSMWRCCIYAVGLAVLWWCWLNRKKLFRH